MPCPALGSAHKAFILFHCRCADGLTEITHDIDISCITTMCPIRENGLRAIREDKQSAGSKTKNTEELMDGASYRPTLARQVRIITEVGIRSF